MIIFILKAIDASIDFTVPAIEVTIRTTRPMVYFLFLRFTLSVQTSETNPSARINLSVLCKFEFVFTEYTLYTRLHPTYYVPLVYSVIDYVLSAFQYTKSDCVLFSNYNSKHILWIYIFNVTLSQLDM